MLKNRSQFVGLAAFVAGLVVASLSFSVAAPQDDKAPDADAIQALLKERAEILKSVWEIEKKGFDNATGSVYNVHQARLAWLDAQLDLSATNAERVAILKDVVAEAELWHASTAEALHALIGDKTEELKAKARVLEARVALARAQQPK